jgi:hypothetical protein
MLFTVGHLTLDELDVLYDEMAADAAADAPPGVRVVPSGLALIGVETVNAYQEGRAPRPAGEPARGPVEPADHRRPASPCWQASARWSLSTSSPR